MRLIDADALFEKVKESSEDAGFYTPIYNGFLASIVNAPTIEQPTWISCDERLPCESERVLIFDKWGDVHIAEFFGGDVKRMWRCYEWWCSQGSVTHWMPMPQPPKGG